MEKNKKAMFELKSKYTPSGDQPQAIEELVNGLKKEKNTKYYLEQQEPEKLLQLQT